MLGVWFTVSLTVVFCVTWQRPETTVISEEKGGPAPSLEEFRNCVKVMVAVLGFPSLISVRFCGRKATLNKPRFPAILPNCPRNGYATEGPLSPYLLISANLFTDVVSVLRKVLILRLWKQHSVQATLRASLSGTFLQTLPDLVTPLKGHSLSPRSCPPTRSAPSESFGY